MLESAFFKLQRAQEHRNSFERYEAIWKRSFVTSEAFECSTRINDKTRDFEAYILRITQPKERFGLLFSDAISNYRCALDHAAQEIALQNFPLGSIEDRNIAFKVLSNPSKFGRSDFWRLVAKHNHPLFRYAMSLKPWKGGNDLLWGLVGLDNFGKHQSTVKIRSGALMPVFGFDNLGQFIGEGGHFNFNEGEVFFKDKRRDTWYAKKVAHNRFFVSTSIERIPDAPELLSRLSPSKFLSEVENETTRILNEISGFLS